MSLSRIQPEAIERGIKGQAFDAGIGPVTIPNLSYYRFLLINPVGSGVLMKLNRFRYYTSGANAFGTVRLNPTTNLPVPLLNGVNQRVGFPNGQCFARSDVDTVPMSGGAALPYMLPFSQGRLSEYKVFPTRVIPPGVSIGFDTVNMGVGDTIVLTILDWYEHPVVT